MRTFVFLLLIFAFPAHARFYSCDQLRTLALENVGKVDAFKAVWAIHRNSWIYGGPVRDYLLWMKGMLDQAKTKEEFDLTVRLLSETKVIRTMDFMQFGSDLDVVGAKNAFRSLNAADYGLSNIESIEPNRLNPEHSYGQSELDMGFAPVEKMQINRQVIKTRSRFGDGFQEICDGKFSVTFMPEEQFERGYFARKNLSHPVFLALRAVRLVSLAYWRTYGNAKADPTKVMALLAPGAQEALQSVFKKTIDDPKFFYRLTLQSPPDTQSGFHKFLSKSLRKAVQGNLNSGASQILMEELGAFGFIEKHWSKIPDAPKLFEKNVQGKLVIRRCEDKL